MGKLEQIQKKTEFGICFDVDGVLARGTLPIPEAREAMRLLQDPDGEVRLPVIYVTNSLNRNKDKAAQITNWFDIQVEARQVIGAPGPLEAYKKYHEKHCLILGQGKILEIAKDLGFKNICTIEEVSEAYPLLDMVDHDNRRKIAKYGYAEKSMARIEAVVMLGEPKRWESSLQLLVDILKTGGKPDQEVKEFPERHLPIIACNMDLQFMDRACMPRFGHGAFLLCLEALYKKSTGRVLTYTSLIGKPSETTFRYAEHCLSREAKNLGIYTPLKRMYLIGDTPEVDIVGANLYQRYIDRLRSRTANDTTTTGNDDYKRKDCEDDPQLPPSRNVPAGAMFERQTVTECEGILVCTGVYRRGGAYCGDEGEEAEKVAAPEHYTGHRDFPSNPELCKPARTCQSVLDAVRYILERERDA